MFRSSSRGIITKALVFVSCGALAFGVGSPANASIRDHDRQDGGGQRVGAEVRVSEGLLKGEELGDLLSFRGVPYAAPPVGDLRFRPPAPAEGWSGVREATEYEFDPAQPENPGAPNPSEDSLYLNIITPAEHTNEKLPVIVTFHGGGLEAQSSNAGVFNAPDLSSHGVVTISVNARLGALGFLALPELTAESRQGASGNYGILDLIAALKWVKKNVAQFGGDPGNITLSGHSGGGSKVTTVLASPLAKGLASQAATQSPARLGAYDQTLDEGYQRGKALLDYLGITEGDVLAQLRALPWQQIAAAQQATGFATGITIDGHLLKKSTRETYAAGEQSKVPIILGAGSGETLEYDYISEAAELMTGSGQTVYADVFHWLPSNWRGLPGVRGVPHFFDVPFVYGDLETYPALGSVFSLVAPIFRDPSCPANSGPPTDPADPNSTAIITTDDQYFANRWQSVYAAFAATGDPDVTGVVDWPAFDPDNPQYAHVDDTITIQPWTKAAFIC